MILNNHVLDTGLISACRRQALTSVLFPQSSTFQLIICRFLPSCTFQLSFALVLRDDEDAIRVTRRSICTLAASVTSPGEVVIRISQASTQKGLNCTSQLIYYHWRSSIVRLSIIVCGFACEIYSPMCLPVTSISFWCRTLGEPTPPDASPLLSGLQGLQR